MITSSLIRKIKSSKSTSDARKSSLAEILKNQYKVKDDKLVQALVALGEGKL